MEIGFLIFAVLLGAGYVALIVRGLEQNKPWAHEMARTVALMEPGRSYMDYHYLARPLPARQAPEEQLTGDNESAPEKLAA